ncbi:hypothetical protein ECG_07323 [Echinococcus granulosus]|uniref:Sugar transporter n=2 Tax=Echinococcus granulosus TaxID=6210 RepID=A0A068WWC4_ECHGR|nr:hypothetical protein ECG_07323 [Echinococcus granulosus]CDS22005.1 Sugar transporter [Echinococcus granulosus]
MRNPIIPSPGIPPDQFICKSGNCNCELSSFTVVLDELNIKYIFTAGYNAGVAAAIAVLLDCPLLASDALYYVMSCSQTCGSNEIIGKLKFHPISGLSFSPIQVDSRENFNSSTLVHFLEGHLYNPIESFLSHLPPISCRIFGLLWGDSAIPRLHLPPEAVEFDLRNKSNVSRKKIFGNAIRLAQWIGEVGPSKALQNVVELIGDLEFKNVLSQCIPQSISRTQMDLKEAFLILQELDRVPTFNEGTCERISAILHGKSNCQSVTSPLRICDPIIDHWPARMLKAYRRGLVCPFLLSSLYFEGGIVFKSNLDYVAGLPSSYMKALTVRYLTYCLMYTYEMSIGGCSHLNGTKPSLIEIHPISSESVKLIFITLEHIHLPDHETHMHFICNAFSYAPNPTLPDWLNLFSLCLMIWYKQRSRETSELQYCNPSDCPIILAACVCALAQFFNYEEAWETVLAKYEEVSEIAHDMATSDNSNSTNNESELPESQQGQWIMHSLMEIQNIYTEIIALSKFIKALSFYNSTADSLQDRYDDCRPLHQIFTSNKLFYWIAKHLYSVPIEARNYKAIRGWLPRLLTPSSIENISERCIIVVTDLANLLQHLRSANIELLDIKLAESEAPITKIIAMSKNCANVRRTLESFLQSEDVAVEAKPKSQSPVSRQHQALTCKKENNGNYLAFGKSVSHVPYEQDTEPTVKTAKQSNWVRRRPVVSPTDIQVNRVPCHEVIGENSASTARWRRTGRGYAARLKKRVGIE